MAENAWQNKTHSQVREGRVSEKIIELFTILSANEHLNFSKVNQVVISLANGNKLLNISSSGFSIPNIPLHESLFGSPSPLSDRFVPDTQTKNLVLKLSEKNLIVRLNHLGFCYLVPSKNEEKTRLSSLISLSDWHLYQEASNDSSDWFFLGDKTNWTDPLIEFVPSEGGNDKWRDYWLPHISIDIDTQLTGEEIEHLVTTYFAGAVRPYRLIVVNGNICLIRARLGCVSGVNIYMDFGTLTRGVEFHRNNLLIPVL